MFELFMSEVKYLGHIVSVEGVQTDPDKIKALKSWPVSKNVKESRLFKVSRIYYRLKIKQEISPCH